MHRIFRVKAYEKEHGPHFNEEYARKAVMKMENEDGTRGPHWSLEETTTSLRWVMKISCLYVTKLITWLTL